MAVIRRFVEISKPVFHELRDISNCVIHQLKGVKALTRANGTVLLAQVIKPLDYLEDGSLRRSVRPVVEPHQPKPQDLGLL